MDRPKEKLRLTIELAENGIIVRDRDDEDNVQLALDSKGIKRDLGYGYDIDHTEVYKLIGRMIYNLLLEVAFQEHHDEWISTGAELDITATLMGRKREEF